MLAPRKSFLYRMAYFRAFGMISGSIGVILFAIINLNKDVFDYPSVSGEIYKSHLRWNKTPFSIKVDKNSTLWYHTYIEKYFDVLDEKAVQGKNVRIWYDKNSHEIEQLVIESEIIIPYHKGKGMAIGFIIFGLVVGTISILYLKENPAHRFGRLE